MSNLSQYADETILEIVNSDVEKELKNRGYEYGWYKKVNYVGVIYILVNPAFSNLVKIGYADNVEKRMKSLNRSSGLPDPYHCYAIFKVKKRLEDLRLHTLIDSLDPTLRHAKNREFYEISKEKAYEILSAIAQINGDEECLIINPLKDSFFDDKIKKNVSLEKQEKPKKKIQASSTKKIQATPSTFDKLNIPLGSILTFVRDDKKTCKVVDNKRVEYQGKVYTTSALAQLLLGTEYTVQGPRWFKYKGKLLTELREELHF